MILKPLERVAGTWWSLADINRGIKGTSARFVNKILGTAGAVWQEESFDRIVRDEKEYEEKMQYMWDNPLKAGLVADGKAYPYYVFPPERGLSA
ncbi:MAG TPA: hypothetical protein VGQ99_22250 [Tepidisphaeraceae bacterium]|nr:hypothetical protein [Tepidisphaeraceae bacterium]